MKSLLTILLCSFSLLTSAQQVFIREPVRFLALGDSYTIGQSVSQQNSWPHLFSAFLNSVNVRVDTLAVIAQTGWTTGNLKNAVKNANTLGKFNLVSLLIGVNNQYQGLDQAKYSSEFEELLKTAIENAGNSVQVFVLSIPDYGCTPFGLSNRERISGEIDAFNAINASLARKYNVAYFNITEISRRGLSSPSLVAADGLHPSGEMYKLWVDLISRGISFQNKVTSLDDIPAKNGEEIHVSVNSADGSIRFESVTGQIPGNATIVIYDLTGRKITGKEWSQNTTLYVYNPSVYIYLIQSGTRLYSGKFMVSQ